MGTEHHRKQARKSHGWANVKSAGFKWPEETAAEMSLAPAQEDTIENSFSTDSVPSPNDQRGETEDLPLSLCRGIRELEKHISHMEMPLEVSKVTYPRGDTFFER